MLDVQGYPMATWATKIPPDQFYELKKWAAETKRDTPFTPEILDLPHYRDHRQPLEDFLRNPDEVLRDFYSPRYWFQLISQATHEKQTVLNIDRVDVLQTIIDTSAKLPQQSLHLHLSEYSDNLYGGNISIGSGGRVLAEFTEGLQGKVASKEVTPEFTVASTPGIDCLKYSFKDERLRRAMWQLINPIKELPGYYEFTILDHWRPIFLDARLTNPIYQIPDPMHEPQNSL